jgi:hypothetical protein
MDFWKFIVDKKGERDDIMSSKALILSSEGLLGMGEFGPLKILDNISNILNTESKKYVSTTTFMGVYKSIDIREVFPKITNIITKSTLFKDTKPIIDICKDGLIKWLNGTDGLKTKTDIKKNIDKYFDTLLKKKVF